MEFHVVSKRTDAHFRFFASGGEIQVDSERQGIHPKMDSITYANIVDTDDADHRLNLLHEHVKQCGTVFNTVTSGIELTGSIWRR